jgi:phosphopantetheinyl transferase (holo-ACP synthase)
MVNGAPLPKTLRPQPHGPRWFNAAAPPVLADLGPHGPVLYASDLAGPDAKERLVRRLLAGLPGRETDAAVPPLTLETTALGQPRLLLKGRSGPAVSFAQAAGRLWAALTPVGQVGVDAALPSEFEESYPWARAFRAPEFAWARCLTGGDTAAGAALLWVLKEAAVKALGVGFHRLDPLAVTAVNPRPWQEWIRVSIKAGEEMLPAWARPAAGGWLALARIY